MTEKNHTIANQAAELSVARDLRKDGPLVVHVQDGPAEWFELRHRGRVIEISTREARAIWIAYERSNV